MTARGRALGRRGGGPGRAPPAALLAAILLAALALSCRREERAGAPPGPAPAPARPTPAAEGADYTMADLVAAARLDARLQRANALAGEYKAALTFDRGPRLSEHTDRIAKRLAEAVLALERALDEVRDPRDRARAAPVVAAARRWPGLLSAARAELLASPRPATAAANELAATDDELAAALDAYRGFRAGWRIVDSPQEREPVLRFLRARRALEETEAALGRRLQAPAGGPPVPDAAAGDELARRLGEAREAAGGVDEDRRAAAQRYVEAQARAIERLAAIGDAGAAEEKRARDALDYQLAKAAALEALAEYVERTAGSGRGAAPAQR